ncbi:hypothetical protein KKF84_10385 [Myxococcota bacterium]|nr:hypothetical protein [Myxococcota bacterium]MBU1535718.1 hypothetical protein [Myxococcota bacterium]
MKRLLFGTTCLAVLWLSSCVVPFPLEEEEAQTFNPPRFRRDYCLPGYTLSVVVDSIENETIKMVVEDLDINEGIEFRIFKDYYQCASTTDPSNCHMKLITEGEIPPTGSEIDSEYGRYVRTYTYPLKKSLLCSSAAGDTLGSSHIIEVVITDAFLRDANIWPYWRKSIGDSDVWTFRVECVSGFKSKPFNDVDDPDLDLQNDGEDSEENH